ncbi:restriction endonuclease subunit S [Endozoicomonas sp. (ex Bugula neritina AB1)]|nr:restriction endonuclease subunit S [Endozoicomonas sp. (ex Bugula neritina AB1)]
MNSHWGKVKLGNVLVRRKESVDIDEGKNYQEVTVRLWGKGVTQRGEKQGCDIGAGKRFSVSAGQFIVSKIDARHGAFGIVPENLDGAVVTTDFPVYDVDPEYLDVNFLAWFSKTPTFIDACKKASEGTTNRVRLKEHLFAEITVALPEPTEQRRIVKKIELLNSQILLARELRHEIVKESHAMLSSAFHELTQDVQYAPMSKVAPLVRRPVTVEISEEYPELGVRSFGKGTFHKPVLNGIDVGTKKLFYIHPDDLVFSNVFAWEGAIAVAKANDKGRVGSHRFITCVPKPRVSTPEFLRFYFLTNEGLGKIREASPGGAGRNKTLGLKKLENIEVPVPAYEKQIWFNSLQKKMAEIQEAQKANETELEALMPSILDKAFKGELV